MTPPAQRPDTTGVSVFLTLLVLCLFLVVVAGAAGRFDAPVAEQAAPASAGARAGVGAPDAVAPPEARPEPTALPHGGSRIFDGRMLVAYYGTVGTGVLGVLGETDPDRAIDRVVRAARPFARAGRAAQPVFELIVTVADAYPGKDGDYSHDVDHRLVRAWVEAAHRHGALLVLDVQPGRADFLTVAKRWEWALREPWVGLALDPEWRMGPREVPGRVIGSVGPIEVNRTSAWLAQLTADHGLPQKLFVLHQFRTTMLREPERIARRARLATVQHVDGFGTPGQKLDTYRVVARPSRFRMGFKLFYDEDVPRMSAAQVLRIRPRVDFVSFQ